MAECSVSSSSLSWYGATKVDCGEFDKYLHKDDPRPSLSIGGGGFREKVTASSGVKQDSPDSIQSTLTTNKFSENGSINCKHIAENCSIQSNISGQESKSDVTVKKGAVSLVYLALSKDGDGVSKVKKDTQPEMECSSESYESMVLKCPESSSMDDYCVSSNPYKVTDHTRDLGIKLRRGKRRLKDFRKDILPQLSSLSSDEISQDMKLLRSRVYNNRLKSKIPITNMTSKTR